MKHFVTLIIIFLFNLLLSSNKEPEKIGLVLSGGGIKGFGHIGTIHLLDSLNIPIDFIVGTSIGSISGALYATGHSSEEIEKIAYNTQWKEIFNTTRNRNYLYYFQKIDLDKYQLSFALNGLKPTMPLSLTSGQYSYEHLSNLFKSYHYTANYDSLYIPFRCNAIDIIDGNEVIFESGSISKSLRASTSIPTVFSPLENNNLLLADGGLINNLATDIAQAYGADFIIAVDVSAPPKSKHEINDFFNVIQKIMILNSEKNKKENLQKADILISPKLNNSNVLNFNSKQLDIIKKQGYKAAYNQIDKLLELKESLNNKNNSSLKLKSINNDILLINKIFYNGDIAYDNDAQTLFNNNSEYTKNELLEKINTIRQKHTYKNINFHFTENKDKSYNLFLNGKIIKPIILSDIEIRGNKKFSSKQIKKFFTLDINKPIDIHILDQEISNAYATDFFHYIYYDIEQINTDNVKLIINIKENPTKRLKLGALWDSHYKLIGKIKIDLINKPNSNFRFNNELFFSGIKKNTLSLLYQGTNYNKFNIVPFISFINSELILGFNNNNNIIKYYEHKLNEIKYGINILFKNYGNMELSYHDADNTYDNIEIDKYKISYTQLHLKIDQIDDLLHPRSGYYIVAKYSSNTDGNSHKYSNIDYNINLYKTYQNNTLRLYHLYKENTTNVPIHFNSHYINYDWAVGYNEFQLSGELLSLSGFEYQYHYKNSTTLRFIISKIHSLNKYDHNFLTTYGIGIKLRSILGPINFIWGKGPKELFSKRLTNNTYYFNFGINL